MRIKLVPTAEAHFEGLYQALDTVAREGKYLALLQAPPREAAFAFFRDVVARDLCQFVALADGVVVGWCDVLPVFGDARAHVGVLGIGLLPSVRGQGIGKQLMGVAISKAWTKGFARIELDVRTDNDAARKLYERCGFFTEGTLRHRFCVGGVYFDAYAMSLLR